MPHLGMWVIYDHPDDYPEHFVVRLWRVEEDRMRPGTAQLADSLEAARGLIPIERDGLVWLPWQASDDRVILEVWA